MIAIVGSDIYIYILCTLDHRKHAKPFGKLSQSRVYNIIISYYGGKI